MTEAFDLPELRALTARSQPTPLGTPGPRIAYQSDVVTLWEGDCAAVIADLSRDSADLIATDPPYGVKWKARNFPVLAGDDGSLDVPDILGAATRALRNHRHVYVFGYTPEQLAGPMRLGSTAELVWDKGQNPGLTNGLDLAWGRSHEPVTFGVHGKYAGTRGQGVGGLAARLRRGSVMQVPRVNSRANKRHPTEKPVALMRQLIESSSLLGDVVFDPFAGSGSTLVAAILAGRRALGVEIDPRYVATAIDRIKHAERLAAEMSAV